MAAVRTEQNKFGAPMPPPDDHLLNNVVRRLRLHVAHLPLRIHTIHGRGLLLEVEPTSRRGAAAPRPNGTVPDR